MLALRLSSVVIGWVSSLGKLELAWKGVGAAATVAAGEEAVAAGGAGVAGAAGAAGATGVAARVGAYTGAGAAAARGGSALTLGRFGAIAAGVFGGIPDQVPVNGSAYRIIHKPDGFYIKSTINGFEQKISNSELAAMTGGRNTSDDRPQPGGARFGGPRVARPTAPRTPTVFKSFTDTIGNQLAQARAALTKGTQDDVAAAKREIAQIKKEIAAGHLKGASLIQALQAEAAAVNTIQSIEAAAAQKRAAAAQALKAKIQARIEASIDPLKLEVALSRDQADNAKKKQILHDLKALRAAARKALASGDLSLAQQKEAYDAITSYNSQIHDLSKKTKDAAKNAYKQVNQAKFLGGLDLTPAQRKALRQRLAQLGPGGTVGSDRVGAYGYQIGANDRPIHVHTRVDIDGHKVAQNTTKHQQRRRRRNSSQRRGPQAGDNG